MHCDDELDYGMLGIPLKIEGKKWGMDEVTGECEKLAKYFAFQNWSSK